MLQCVATHDETLALKSVQYVAVCCSVLQCVAARDETLTLKPVQCVAVCCSVLQYVAVCCSVLQCVPECCRVLQSVDTEERERTLNHAEVGRKRSLVRRTGAEGNTNFAQGISIFGATDKTKIAAIYISIVTASS